MLLILMMVAATSCEAAEGLWRLTTADTQLTVRASATRPVVTELKCTASTNNWAREEIAVPLMPRIWVGERECATEWTYKQGAYDEKSGILTLAFENKEPRLELLSIWRARPGPGPVEHWIELRNLSGQAVTLSHQDSLSLNALVPGGQADLCWINRGAGNASTQGGTFREPLTAKTSLNLVSNCEDGASPVPWLAVQAGEEEGLYVGWEFSGLGRIQVSAINDGNGLAISLGNLPDFKTDIEAGETFHVPPAFIGCYQGGLDEGAYCLHQWILASLRPLMPDGVPDPTLAYNLYLDAGGGKATEDDVLRSAAFCHDLGFETFMPDAMWFPECGDWRWDPARFPNGIKPIEEYVHGHGMRLALWCAWTNGGVSDYPDALSVRGAAGHPDWFNEDFKPDWQPGPFFGGRICLGSHEAKEWGIAKTQWLAANHNIDYLKHDCGPITNTCNKIGHRHHYGVDASYWATVGYYEVQEKLRKAFPNLILENCSGGGHLKDFGAMARTHYTVTTDTLSNLPDRQSIYDSTFAFPPVVLQAYTYERAYNVPGDDPGHFLWRSGMMGAWQIDPTNTQIWTEEERESAKRDAQIYKEWIRPILRDAQVHHILPRPDGVHWDGMFYWSPTLKRGTVYIFRPEADEDEKAVVLKGLVAEKEYWVWSEDGSISPGVRTGSEMMGAGLEIRLTKRYSSDLIYLQDAELGKPQALSSGGPLPKESNSHSPWQCIVTGTQSEAEQLATADLQRYLAQVTAKAPQIITASQWRSKPVAAVLLGTPENNELLAPLSPDAKAADDQGYHLERRALCGAEAVVAIGSTPSGAVNAIYGLLRELGFGFYLGSEAVPDHLPATLPSSPIDRKPDLAIRGVLPWYNFFNSPTSWDPVDHRAFIDQLVRMGANFLGFHTYDHEPFAAYQEGGEMKCGGRLVSTSSPTWGTHSLSTTEFAGGTDRLFSEDSFGASTTQLQLNSSEAIRTEQAIMRDSLDYAARRGLHTCLGFEITGDPIDPQVRDIFLKRLNHLLDEYPALDRIWLWQPETQGVQGFTQRYHQHILPSEFNPASALALYGEARRGIFERIVEKARGEKPFYQDNETGKAARALEGARLEQFAQLAWRAIHQRENPPRLIISGWGGDERLLSAEYYEGLDKLLPKDVIFSSLDHIAPRERVDQIYHQLPPDRERWPIVWLENDGDQWHPQPCVHTFERTIGDVKQGGSQGILGIHWRTRDIEENFSFLVDAAWNPGLTAYDFFLDLAHRCYGPEIADEMAVIHSDLDKLGYRWIGGSGQNECAPFAWGLGDAGNALQLQQIRERVLALLPRCGKGEARIRWLLACMDWTLSYGQLQKTVSEAAKLLSLSSNADNPQTGEVLARQALSLLDPDHLDKALHAYTSRLSTRGEYGVLATINTKAAIAWRDLRTQCLAEVGRESTQEPSDGWTPQPRIVLPRFLGSVDEREDLELAPIILGGQKAWIHFRQAGSAAWTTRPLEPVRGWVQQVRIPAAEVPSPGLELGFSFSEDSGQAMDFGPIGVTVMPHLKVNTEPRPVVPFAIPASPSKLELQVLEGETTPVELVWEVMPEADFFQVIRNEEPVVQTAVAYYPDAPAQATNTYCVEALRGGHVIARSDHKTCQIANTPLIEAASLELEANQAGVLLRWPGARSLSTASFRIDRKSHDGSEDSWQRIVVLPALRGLSHIYRNTPPEGDWDYRLTPMSAVDSEGKAAMGSIHFPPQVPAQPLLQWSLTQKPEGVQTVGQVSFTREGALFDDGYLTFPHTPELDLDHGITLCFEFRIDAPAEMPVLLCHGQWNGDGWFVQILGGQLVVRMPDGDARGPRIEPGKFYEVKFVFDGIQARLAINGHWLEQEALVIRPVSQPRDLIIGNYSQPGSSFQFKGAIRNLAVWADALYPSPAGVFSTR
jgi:alpha-galactosidase